MLNAYEEMLTTAEIIRQLANADPKQRKRIVTRVWNEFRREENEGEGIYYIVGPVEKKIYAIKAIREVTNMSLADTKNFVENPAPNRFPKNWEPGQARRIADALSSLGVKIERRGR